MTILYIVKAGLNHMDRSRIVIETIVFDVPTTSVVSKVVGWTTVPQL